MTDLYIGMLSGTSRDGADLALVSFESGRPVLHQTSCEAYPENLAERLQQMIAGGNRPDDGDLRRMDLELANFFGAAVNGLLKEAGRRREDITAIGSHGQTVWHDPPESIQLGDPAKIARHTGITTVGRFRQADLEAGGQGAPLAPLLHRWLFKPGSGTRVVVNLGGIANISVIGSDGSVSGFDTGPANCLLDAWVRRQRGSDFDRDGKWGAGGTVQPMLLLDLMSDPYFKKPPPKSTGLEYFHLGWLESGGRLNGTEPVDVQATLAQLTASTVAAAVTPSQPEDVLVCGGGCHNQDLMRRLQDLMPGCPVASTARFGLDPDWVEAVLFAWLAKERLDGTRHDTRDITGADSPVMLGTVETI